MERVCEKRTDCFGLSTQLAEQRGNTLKQICSWNPFLHLFNKCPWWMFLMTLDRIKSQSKREGNHEKNIEEDTNWRLCFLHVNNSVYLPLSSPMLLICTSMACYLWWTHCLYILRIKWTLLWMVCFCSGLWSNEDASVWSYRTLQGQQSSWPAKSSSLPLCAPGSVKNHQKEQKKNLILTCMHTQTHTQKRRQNLGFLSPFP